MDMVQVTLGPDIVDNTGEANFLPHIQPEARGELQRLAVGSLLALPAVGIAMIADRVVTRVLVVKLVEVMLMERRERDQFVIGGRQSNRPTRRPGRTVVQHDPRRPLPTIRAFAIAPVEHVCAEDAVNFVPRPKATHHAGRTDSHIRSTTGERVTPRREYGADLDKHPRPWILSVFFFVHRQVARCGARVPGELRLRRRHDFPESLLLAP
eukprot:2672083-Prymnesium_polylepis.1